MKKNTIVTRIVSVTFVIFLFVEFIMNGSYARIGDIFNSISSVRDTETYQTIDEIERKIADSFWGKRKWIDISGWTSKILDMRSLYNRSGLYVSDDDRIFVPANKTSTDYEYYETIDFNDFLKSNGINFLYVNEPTKYVDDSFFVEDFGIETHSNENMDVFLKRIREYGVDTLDLRDIIHKDDLNINDMFYRTDQHWTVPTGLWASEAISSALNTNYGYNIDLSLFDENRYIKKEWKNCWLGELGRKMSEPLVGLDDFTELKPDYDTDFTFFNDDGTSFDGNFDYFIEEIIYDTNNNVYYNPSWHYSYNMRKCINNDVSSGRILLVCDSFGYVTQPFLSLGMHEVDWVILRDCEESFSLRKHILENNYDTVVVAYTQHMLGSHDNQNSSNYNMYAFDK